MRIAVGCRLPANTAARRAHTATPALHMHHLIFTLAWPGMAGAYKAMVRKRHAPCDERRCRRRHRCQAAKLAASRSSQPRRPRQWQRNQQQLHPAARRCRTGSCGYRRLCQFALGNLPLLLSAKLHQSLVPVAVAADLATPSSSAVFKRRSVAVLSCTVSFSCTAHACSSGCPACSGTRQLGHKRGNSIAAAAARADACQATCGSDIIAAIEVAGP